MMPIAPLPAFDGDGMRPQPQLSVPATTTAPGIARTAGPSALAQDFEAAMLAPLVEAMLPPEGGAVWGEGGRVWRGVFASELAGEIARSGGVGLAEMVEDVLASRTEDRS